MTTARFDDLEALAATRQTWFGRLCVHLLDWQAQRAQRVIDHHAHLIADCTPAFRIRESSASRDATWSALHHGVTCEAGLRADPPARDFNAL
jgi:hypothetical protein